MSQPLSSSLAAPPGTGSCSKVSLQPSLPQAEQPQLSQPFLPAEGLQPSDHCWGLLRPRSHSSSSVLCWGLQSWTQDSLGGSQQSGAEGQNPLGLGMQPRAQVSTGTASTHCWVTLSSSCAITPKSSAGLLSIPSSPACTDTGDCPHPCAGLCSWLCWTSWGRFDGIVPLPWSIYTGTVSEKVEGWLAFTLLADIRWQLPVAETWYIQHQRNKWFAFCESTKWWNTPAEDMLSVWTERVFNFPTQACVGLLWVMLVVALDLSICSARFPSCCPRVPTFGCRGELRCLHTGGSERFCVCVKRYNATSSSGFNPSVTWRTPERFFSASASQNGAIRDCLLAESENVLLIILLLREKLFSNQTDLWVLCSSAARGGAGPGSLPFVLFCFSCFLPVAQSCVSRGVNCFSLTVRICP